MSKKIMYYIILLMFPMFFSCEREIIYSQTELNTIITLSSKEDRLLVEPLVNELFNKTIFTPQPEQYFNVKWIDILKFERYKKYPNLLIASLENPIDSTIDRYIKRFSEDLSTNNLVVINNPFYNNQIMGIINSKDLFQFDLSLTKNKKWFLNQFEGNMLINLENYVFSKGVNVELNDYIQDKYGYLINLQEDFRVIKEDKNNKFLWLGRGYPYRWLILFEVKSNFIKKKHIENWDLIIKYINKFVPSIEIDNYYRSFAIDKKNDSNKYEIYRGVYSHKESQTGGPFFTYLLQDKESIIFISGFVNFPGKEKLFILNQLEIIARTIRKEQHNE